jgi:hypothetical protein
VWARHSRIREWQQVHWLVVRRRVARHRYFLQPGGGHKEAGRVEVRQAHTVAQQAY